MKKIFLLLAVLSLVSLCSSAQELTQVVPNCERRNVTWEYGSTPPPPAIPNATKEMKPVVLKKVKAKYTKEALELCVHGNVLINAVFRADGKIDQIRALRGLPNGLTQAAIEAAKRVVFKPALKDGVPVSVRMNLEFGFNISKLDNKMIVNFLKDNFKFLSNGTRELMAKKYHSRKLSSKDLDLLPFEEEAFGVNLLDAEKRSEFLKLREEGIRNLCPKDQDAYLDLSKDLKTLITPTTKLHDQDLMSYKLQRFFGFRHAGIQTLPIEKQKRFVELYNEAVLLGLNSTNK